MAGACGCWRGPQLDYHWNNSGFGIAFPAIFKRSKVFVCLLVAIITGLHRFPLFKVRSLFIVGNLRNRFRKLEFEIVNTKPTRCETDMILMFLFFAL